MNSFRFSTFLIPLIINLSCTKPTENEGLEITFVNFENLKEPYVNSSIGILKENFKVDTLILLHKKLPEEAYYKPRNRYRADKLIRHLRDEYPSQKVIGLTSQDISTTSGEHEDWGIMGLAFRPGRSCIVSTHRTFRGAKNETHKTERLNKVVLHEFGHTLGLPHCENSEECLMRDANGKVATVDMVKDFCTSCKAQIKKYLRD